MSVGSVYYIQVSEKQSFWKTGACIGIQFFVSLGAKNILALRAKFQTGCSLRGHWFFRDFYFSETCTNAYLKVYGSMNE
uniref:Uncharacterized protein n=1 Tax=Candidatus Kentrum sp. SD TaxID=2126332 RepID=A0A451BJ70_9GAMM|nr:MAG: hypothetical protein BECKSD772D_GA0070982_101119 [Candidatus Kentron sp. SD]